MGFRVFPPPTPGIEGGGYCGLTTWAFAGRKCLRRCLQCNCSMWTPTESCALCHDGAAWARLNLSRVEFGLCNGQFLFAQSSFESKWSPKGDWGQENVCLWLVPVNGGFTGDEGNSV